MIAAPRESDNQSHESVVQAHGEERVRLANISAIVGTSADEWARSASGGQTADALANAARNGPGVKAFVANIVKVLISGLQQARLLEINDVKAEDAKSNQATNIFVVIHDPPATPSPQPTSSNPKP